MSELETMAKALVLLSLLACAAQDPQPQPQPAAVAATSTGLQLAAPPAGWQPRAKDPAAKKAFLVDYDLSGGARVNVLPYELAFEPYLDKLLGRWTDEQDRGLTRPDAKVFELPLPAGIAGRTIEVHGTRHPHEGPEEPNEHLLAVHLTPMEGDGYWSAWLIGPSAAVQANRAEFLAWVRGSTLR